jgi:hypothetical protein
MARPLSPIHRPLDPVIADLVDKDPPPAPPTRISRLAALDQRLLSGTVRSLGPGGASAAFSNAVQKALVDEMADQLRGGTGESLSEIGRWATEIIDAFREE